MLDEKMEVNFLQSSFFQFIVRFAAMLQTCTFSLEKADIKFWTTENIEASENWMGASSHLKKERTTANKLINKSCKGEVAIGRRRRRKNGMIIGGWVNY